MAKTDLYLKPFFTLICLSAGFWTWKIRGSDWRGISDRVINRHDVEIKIGPWRESVREIGHENFKRDFIRLQTKTEVAEQHLNRPEVIDSQEKKLNNRKRRRESPVGNKQISLFSLRKLSGAFPRDQREKTTGKAVKFRVPPLNYWITRWNGILELPNRRKQLLKTESSPPDG